MEKNVTICTFGDLVRVPGSTKSLADARSLGGKIQMVYSPMDAFEYAKEHKDEQVVFLSVGFETTTPASCLSVKMAKEAGLTNYALLTANKTMPGAYEMLKDSADVFLYPGHVNAITGNALNRKLCEEEGISGIVTGFTASEILTAFAVLLKKFPEGNPFFVNAYPRVVTEEGSIPAQKLIKEWMEPCDSQWRGLGMIKNSGLRLRKEAQDFDARVKFSIPKMEGRTSPACRCGDVLQGNAVRQTVKYLEKAVHHFIRLEPVWYRMREPAQLIISIIAGRITFTYRVLDIIIINLKYSKNNRGKIMDNLKGKTVSLAHGAGGKQTSELIDQVFKAHFANPELTSDDAAVLKMKEGKIAFTTDGFIVSPSEFPGGNIGKLSICGTVNDLSCMGAKPLYLSCAFVIEEGFRWRN